MILKLSKGLSIGLLLIFLASCQVHSDQDRVLVKNKAEFAQATQALAPGDTIVLANGVWEDFEILFVGEGSPDAPITLTVETKGQVFITGRSNLRIAGEHILVSGLVFKEGYTPTDSVISFRRNSSHLANNSRITEVVIDNFNNPERTETDYWVAMYGKNNRFDHNHLEGKRNRGVTMAERLNTEASQENHHRIDHNYFGPRPILGSNGGETLRIGTSAYSLINSYTLIENNYFDRCDGELEIISNKSGGNIIRGNVFFESRGTLTLRHGSGNLVEDNVFFGNGVDHTGGIRVINGDQTIRNNYMETLAGYRFGGALVVMNGVPNSPINRYHQVENALIENNSLINSDHVQLAAGSDLERSAVPVDSLMRNNLFYTEGTEETFTVYDDVSGIQFLNNAQQPLGGFAEHHNFIGVEMQMQRAENGLLYPKNPALSEIGVSRELRPIGKEATGIGWYPKSEKLSKFSGGSEIRVDPGEDSIFDAVQSSQAGDILVLSDGDYVVSKIIQLSHPLTVRSASGSPDAVRIAYERTALFEILDGGSLFLKGLSITGAQTPDSAGNTLIRTQKSSMLVNYELIVEDSRVVELDVNHSFNFLTVAKSTFADRIEISNSHFEGITGSVLDLDEETDDFGIYNSEYVTIDNSSFHSIGKALVNYYRGGTDESTFGPHFLLQNSEMADVGHDARNKTAASIYLHGVQVSNIQDNHIGNSLAISVAHTVGEPRTRISGNRFENTAQPVVVELNSNLKDTATILDNTYF